tara:strand:+ start:3945 stop:5414 length:1470 start_codon:yes stop_codon:yes gene_type:complete
MIELLVSNLSAKKHRYESLGSTQFLVAPVTLIREAVLNGSNGPLFYSGEEIKQVVQEWNGMPAVVNHPYDDQDRPVSARSPRVLNDVGIGYVYNVRYQEISKSLVGEVWIDIEKSNLINTTIVSNIENAKPVDVSTGLALHQEPVADGSTFNETPYTAKATNYKPDHLAILPTSSGACSVAQGCGILVNENKMLVSLNELAHSDVRSQLRTKLEERFSDSSVSIFVSEVFKKFVIFELYNNNTNKGELWKLAYTNLKDSISIDTADPTQVVSKTIFEPVTNSKGGDMPVSTVKTKDDVINTIITNKIGGFLGSDREVLSDFTDDQLTRIANSAPETPKVETPKVETSKVESTTPKVTTNCGCPKTTANDSKSQKTLSFEDMPPQVQAVVANAQKIIDRDKAKLVTKLVANVADDKKEALATQLTTKSVEDLELMVELTGNSKPVEQQQIVPNFYGQGGPTNNSTVTEALDQDFEMCANQLDYAANSDEN